jgi:hypothetical protein
MKTRIKVITKGDDSKTYFPQYKTFLFWYNFTSYSEVQSFDSQAQAEYFIKNAVEKELAKKRKKKIQSIDYIQYP